MKSKWRTTCKREGMSTLYGIYRVLDTNAPDHPGNREYFKDWYPALKHAEHAADILNKSSEEK